MKKIDDKFVFDNIHLFDHKKAVVIVGAGISVASGIPDFRSENGIFAALKKELKINGKELFNYQFGLKPETRKIYLNYMSNLKRLCDEAKPNKTHQFLKDFPKATVYTQNIDGLEERAGVSFTKSMSTHGVYLHGNLETLTCQYCGYKIKFQYTQLIDGKEVECEQCLERRDYCVKNNIRKRPIGLMHPSIIHYNQVHPEAAFIGKKADSDSNADLLIVIGTSLSVDGIKKLVKYFCRLESTKEKRILVNLTPPKSEWSSFFDYFYEGDCNSFVESYENAQKMRKVLKNAKNLEVTKKTSKDTKIEKKEHKLESIDSLNLNILQKTSKREVIAANNSDSFPQTEELVIKDENTVKIEEDMIYESSSAAKNIMDDYTIAENGDTANPRLDEIDNTAILPLSDYSSAKQFIGESIVANKTTDAPSSKHLPLPEIEFEQIQDRIDQIHTQIKRLSISRDDHSENYRQSTDKTLNRNNFDNNNNESIKINVDTKNEKCDNEKMSFESKLEELSRTFSDEELLQKDILNDFIKNSTEAQIDTSNFCKLEDEIEVLKSDFLSSKKLSLTPRKIKKKK